MYSGNKTLSATRFHTEVTKIDVSHIDLTLRCRNWDSVLKAAWFLDKNGPQQLDDQKISMPIIPTIQTIRFLSKEQ